MEPRQIVDTIFGADKNVRYVGVVDPRHDYEVKESRMREGVKSITPDESDREFVQFIPEMILAMADKLEGHTGKIKYSLLCFESVTLMLFKAAEYVVVMSLEAGTFARPIYDRLKPLLGLR